MNTIINEIKIITVPSIISLAFLPYTSFCLGKPILDSPDPVFCIALTLFLTASTLLPGKWAAIAAQLLPKYKWASISFSSSAAVNGVRNNDGSRAVVHRSRHCCAVVSRIQTYNQKIRIRFYARFFFKILNLLFIEINL